MPIRGSRICSRRHIPVASWLVGTVLLALAPGPARAADLFVEVTNPGWENSSQYSWTGAWGDYDKDGYVDLFVGNTASDWTPWVGFLYRNNREGAFIPQIPADVGAIVSEEYPAAGGYWGDFNNDGCLDFLALKVLPDILSPPVVHPIFLNQGGVTFTAADAGDWSRPSYAWGWAALADYDRDGLLDVFLPAAVAETGRRTNQLFQGRGDGTFSLLTGSAIATDLISSSFALDAVWGDYDNDGDPDLAVANYQNGRDFFYRNDGGGQFSRQTNSIVERPVYQTTHHAWADYDNDGLLDLAAGSTTRTRILRNLGGGEFLVATNWTSGYDGTPAWGDYDNDGHLDLLLIRGQGTPLQLRLLHNNGDGTFTRAEDAFTLPTANWLGGGWGDYDNDGFLDLFVANHLGQNTLYHNTRNANHWLKFQLEGTVANRSALGAKVRVKATIGGKTFWQMREVSGGNYCQNDFRPNFGLGDAARADLVRIEWPSGTVQEFTDVAANRIISITEPARLETMGAGRVRVRCWKGMKFELEVSNDLRDWASLGIATNETGTLEFTDPVVGQHPYRFYRAVSR